MIRLILVLLIAILYLVIGCIPAFILWLIGKKNPDLKDRVSRRMIQWIFGVLLFVSGTKVKAEGLENIPKDRAVLYVGNHRSYFDIITSYRLLPGITGYVAKKEMEKIPLLRLWMRYIHCLFLDRSNVKEGLKTSAECAIATGTTGHPALSAIFKLPSLNSSILPSSPRFLVPSGKIHIE